jgi:hypothetical protein
LGRGGLGRGVSGTRALGGGEAAGAELPSDGVAGTRLTMYTFDSLTRDPRNAESARAPPKQSMCARNDTATNP